MPAEHPTPSALDYLLFDPAPFGFPAPALPLLAPLRRGALQWSSPATRPVPAWAGHGRLYSRARYALREAFSLSGVGPAGSLLAPAYHCRTMLDPALVLGAPISLYHLQVDLTPDLDDITQRIRSAAVPVRALLAPHFFGLRQDLAALADVCRQHGVALIEDCAHALPLRTPANGMGSTGTWCVASPYKFFPCEDGGALWSGSGQALPAAPPLQAPSWRAAAGQVRNQLRRLRQRVPASPATLPTTGAPAALAPLTAATRHAQALRQQHHGPSADYQRGRENLACSSLSSWIIGHADIGQIVARRRANFLQWAAAVQGLQQAHAPWQRLGAHDTPYMFPLFIHQPEQRFPALKAAGLPIWRWDSLAQSHCATAADYRLRLLQLPCHQALSEADLAWMFATLRTILGSKASGAAA